MTSAIKSATFLKENSALENLKILADPKLSAAPRTSCITKEIYRKVPYFKPSRERIQAITVNGTLGVALLGIIARTNMIAIPCVVLDPQWSDNFFSTSSRCLGQSIQIMAEPANLLSLFLQTSWIGLYGISAYIAARGLLKDYKESSRIQMLAKEYSAMAESLASKDLPEREAIARRLKANLPLIEANLNRCARLPQERCAQLTRRLSLAADRVLTNGFR